MADRELTPAEKGKATRERNREFWAQRRAEQEAQEREDRERAKVAMRAILDDASATPQQKLDALEILDNLTHAHMIPYTLHERRRGGGKEKYTPESFKAELERHTQGGDNPAE